jgi:membrane protease subunit HflK
MSEQNISPHRPKGKFKPVYILWGLLTLIILIGLVSGFYTVDQTEQAVVLRFGRYISTESSGLHYKLPYGIDKVYKVPTEVIQTVEFGFRTIQPGVNTIYSDDDFSHESNMLTGDLNIVNVTWIIQYKINDPQAWLFNVESNRVYNSNTREAQDNRIKTIRDISQSVINELVGDRATFDVIGEARADIEVTAKQMIDETLASYGLGVDIIGVKLQNIVPPEGEVQEAFEDVNKAYQDMERLINEGQEEYNREIPKADGQALRIIEEAEAYKVERVNRAIGDTSRFLAVYAEYRLNRQVTRDRLYYEMVEEVFGNDENVIIIDQNLDNFIPLQQIGDRRQPAGGTE